MHRLERLVRMLIKDFPDPTQVRNGMDDEDWVGREGCFEVLWYKNNHCIHLEACEHRITLSASYFDGGPCPPQMLVEYCDQRLKALIDWMEKEQPFGQLAVLQTYAYFHEKREKTDPPITKYMFGGRIGSDIWRSLERLEKNGK